MSPAKEREELFAALAGEWAALSEELNRVEDTLRRLESDRTRIATKRTSLEIKLGEFVGANGPTKIAAAMNTGRAIMVEHRTTPGGARVSFVPFVAVKS